MSSIVKVDTIQEKTSANGVTVDGLNIKDSKLVTANSVVASNITADAIDATKIADNAISEEHLDVTSITGHTAETSIADGDTILIHDASASALRKMTKANFVSGIGGANTPAFLAKYGAVVNGIAHETNVKLTGFNTEVYDTNNTFSNNSKFTPGVAGTYQLYGAVSHYDENTIEQYRVYLYKNGSLLANFEHAINVVVANDTGVLKGNTTQTVTWSVTDVADTDDYYEVYFYQSNTNDGVFSIYGESASLSTWFGAYKLIT